jgi:uncharacterized protein DUF6676
MRSRARALSGALVAVVALAAPVLPAIGQTVPEIGDGLAFRRYYIADGAPITVNEMEQLVAAHPDVYFVALNENPAVGTDEVAAELLDVVGSGTVVVLSPDEVGAVSTVYDETTVGRALDVLVEEEDSFFVEFDQFAGGLPGAGNSTEEASGFPWFPVVLAVVVGLIGFTIWRSSRRQKTAQASRLEEARAEIRHQMDVIADQIVKLADDPRADQKPEALAHYRTASETFSGAEGRLAAATTLDALEGLSDDLDRARWDLEATTALLEGRDPPPAPVDEKPEHCFFDPTHGAGVEEAVLQTPAGTRKVMVCRADAEKLRRGEAPVPRELPMGPQRVPAPQAPRSAGGSGLDWLDVFSVIVGGMGQGVDYSWPRQSGRPSSGGLGLPFPGRTSSSPGRASRSRTGSTSAESSSPSSSSPGRPRGRGRRTR